MIESIKLSCVRRIIAQGGPPKVNLTFVGCRKLSLSHHRAYGSVHAVRRMKLLVSTDGVSPSDEIGIRHCNGEERASY